MKFCLVLAAALAAVAAEPFYGGIGYGYDYVSPHPTGVSFIRQSRLDGLGYRGKRDAEADAYGYGGYGYGRGGSYYVGRTIWGLRGKRSAEPFYGYGYGRGVAGHYGGGSSYVGPTVWGLGRKKRDADADAYFGYGGYGYGRGVGAHYGGGFSYVARSPQGLRGKRSAEPFGYGPYGYGVRDGAIAFHPTGTSFTARSPQGLRGKRSAEPGWGYNYNALSGNSFISRSGVGYYPGGEQRGTKFSG